MNYQKHYNLLVERAKNRTLIGYTEKHHIIPECMNGSNDKDNLVRLTPEEHYVAHQLLVKMHPDNNRLVFAVHMMNNGRNNKLYGWIRKLHAKKISEMNIGKVSNRKGSKQTTEAKIKVSMNNPRTKPINTPYGQYRSCFSFAKETGLVTDAGLLNIMNSSDKPITAIRQCRSKIFKKEDIGKTPRDLGWSYR